MKKQYTFLLGVSLFLCMEILVFLGLFHFLSIPLFFNLIISLTVTFAIALLLRKRIMGSMQTDEERVMSALIGSEKGDNIDEKLQEVTRKMRKQIYDLHNLFEVSINLTSILEPQQLIKSSILSVIGQLQTNEAIVFLPTKKDPNVIFPIYSKGFPKEQWKHFYLSLKDPLIQKFGKRMIAIDLLHIKKTYINERWLKLIDSGIHLIAPIIPKTNIRGIIAVGEKMNQEQFSRSEREIFSLLAHFISVAFSNSILYQKMEQISITDGLTGLYNYRYFKRRLEDEILRARRYNHSLSLILFDVDHFKNYNDTLGHPAGDVALKAIAHLLRSTIRKSDIPFRYGGEEFGVILPEAAPQNAANFAKRLREIIASYPFRREDVQPIGKLTISLGVSSFPESADSGQLLIKKADAALYNAKRQGRNRVCIVSELNEK